MFLSHRQKKCMLTILLFYAGLVIYFAVFFEIGIFKDSVISVLNLDYIRRSELYTLQETIKKEKGFGCVIPEMDPFDKFTTFSDDTEFDCPGEDWVECLGDNCEVTSNILEQMKGVQCVYRDIFYNTDKNYTIGPRTFLSGEEIYQLVESDFVDIQCTAVSRRPILNAVKSWKGTKAGLRETIPTTKDEHFENGSNVMILLIDSMSKNQFIRQMPKTYKLLDKMGAVTLNGYNIVGDGTPAALFPLLTGKTEVEHPEARRAHSNEFLNEKSFLFYQLGQYGYRTAFYEDMPWIGTFQRRFNGFGRQPADHYLYPFMLEEYKDKEKHERYHCVGDGSTHGFMLDLTWQFFDLEGKKFSLTVFVDINHEETGSLSVADDSFEEFLSLYSRENLSENTMLIVMGDHGKRYTANRNTFQGKLEERLPLMSIILPTKLKTSRPKAFKALLENVNALTTPFDIHSTILDVTGLTHLRNTFQVPSSDYMRSLSLLKPIPKARTCGDAGVLPHWCACMKWFKVPRNDEMYLKAAKALLNFINKYTEEERSKCALRTLTSIEWVQQQSPNEEVLNFQKALDSDGYLGSFNNIGKKIKPSRQCFQVKITTGPGYGVFEGTLTYLFGINDFQVNEKEISRISAYKNEPHCISANKPHLNKYCFCKE